MSYCDVEGTYAGTANISSDPLFVNAAAGDFHLQAGSPCIDSGSNVGATPADLDGTACPQDGNGDGVAIADMGAYEAPSSAKLLGDFILNPSNPEYIPDRAFRNPQTRSALGQKLNVVSQMISRGDYTPALNQLQNDILKKIDGCAATGAPDRDDWIVDCTSQRIACQHVTRAIEALRVLISQR